MKDFQRCRIPEHHLARPRKKQQNASLGNGGFATFVSLFFSFVSSVDAECPLWTCPSELWPLVSHRSMLRGFLLLSVRLTPNVLRGLLSVRLTPNVFTASFFGQFG